MEDGRQKGRFMMLQPSLSRARAALLAATVAAALVGRPAEAGSLVAFDGPADEPEPLRLLGYLAQPATGGGRFPAVVVLPGCGGFTAATAHWVDRLRRWGYVALAVDSQGSRHLDRCGAELAARQPADAYAALQFLAARPVVDAQRIALLGFSLGGGSVLAALQPDAAGAAPKRRFRAGIAFYPVCAGKNGVAAAPLLVLIGDADDQTPAEACRAIFKQRPGEGAAVQLLVYPGAGHGFDLGLGEAAGGPVVPDPAAAVDAEEQVRRFLGAELGR
jgi:dienelactone hydrolase